MIIVVHLFLAFKFKKFKACTKFLINVSITYYLLIRKELNSFFS